MSDIRGWLEDLGLGQYGDAFEENEIGRDLLPDVTDQTLKDMGISIAGHRIRILKAARRTSESAGHTMSSVAEAEPNAAAGQDAERRQITVMFSDLVGSTALAERLDPEDLRSLMAAYQKACGAIVDRFGGHVAQYLGDGLMVYFGWPQAHEDDATRAVQAGLEIINQVGQLEVPIALAVRIGIATGLVVVGDTGGGDPSVAKAAVGETPNLAARIQGLAQPNTVAISETTRRLVGGAFELVDLGAQELKGVTTAGHIFAVLDESQAETRFDATRPTNLTQFVGRETEVSMLLDRWTQAKEGEGQVVLVSGEAGIGKSRIAQEVYRHITPDPHTLLRFQCSPYHVNSAFHPIVDQLERAAGFARDDTPEDRVTKLRSLLSKSGEISEVTEALFASLLSLPEDQYPPLDMSAQRQKDSTIAALADQVVRLSRTHPLYLLFEDAHWCDPTTLEALNAIIDRVRDKRVLIVITARPEFKSPWIGFGHAEIHSLRRLSRRLGSDMVAQVTGGKQLPTEVLDQIVAKTDGVPLFLEELTKTVLEAGTLIEAGDHYELDGALPRLDIPMTLQDSLMARLDRIASVKEIAQIGACIGREFSQELLTAISPLNPTELGNALDQLVASELVFRHGYGPDATYTFKHALVQDAAYQSLLLKRRSRIHQKLAYTIQSDRPELAQSQPEILGHHFSAAGDYTQSVSHWTQAGKLAVRRSAIQEAIRHFERGLQDVRMLPGTQDNMRLELEIQAELGPALVAGRSNVPQTIQTYERAYELANVLNVTEHLFPSTYGMWFRHALSAEHVEARDKATELLSLATENGDRAAIMVASRLLGTSNLYLGEIADAREQLSLSWSRYDRNADAKLAYDYVLDPGVSAAALLGVAHALSGYLEQAVTVADEGTELAKSLGYLQTSYTGHLWGGVFTSILVGDDLALDRHLNYMQTLTREGELAERWAFVDAYCLVRDIRLDAVEFDAAATLAQQLTDRDSPLLYRPFVLAALARSLLDKAEPEVILKLCARAEETASISGEIWTMSEIHTLRGEANRRTGVAQSEVENDIRKGLNVAKQQGAKLYELRAASALARLRQSQDMPDHARDILAPVYDWFTEGFDTADLKAAKALLEELA